MPSWILWSAAATLAALLTVLLAVGWVFSTRILTPEPYGLYAEFELLGVEPQEGGTYRVTLPEPGERQFNRTTVQGRYALLWDGGSGDLGPVVTQDASGVVREVELTDGRPPQAGDAARLDAYVFRPDPSVRNLDFQDVTINTPVGPAPAWWLPGEQSDTAVVMVHGRRRASRIEALRALPAVASTDASVLVPTYRNHDAAPMSPDGFFQYGESETADVAAALAWLQGRGVERVVLMGYSMGAGIALGLEADWPDDAPELVGLVLDAPMVDPLPAFETGAQQMGLPAPGLLARLAVNVARFRTGVDFAALDRRKAAPGITVPVLLYAGRADTTTPIESIDDFHARLKTEVTYERLDGVEHVEAWNADLKRYEAVLTDFLTPLVRP